MCKNFFLLVVLLASCSRVPEKPEVATSILTAAAKSELLDLDQIADFAWDEMCVVGPFVHAADVSRNLGFQWRGKITGRSGSLIFVDTEDPRSDSVATAHVPLRTRSLLVAAAGCIPRAHAKFTVQSSGGSRTLVPVNEKYRRQAGFVKVEAPLPPPKAA